MVFIEATSLIIISMMILLLLLQFIVFCHCQQQQQQSPFPRYHLTEEERNMVLHDDIGNAFRLGDFFPENKNQKFGYLQFIQLHTISDPVPISYSNMDLSAELKCTTHGRGLLEFGQCVFEKIDINKDDMVDVEELNKAKAKLTWLESTIGYIGSQTSEKVINYCAKTNSSSSRSHTKMTLVGLLTAQRHCRTVDLPLPTFGKAKLLHECDANHDGKLSIEKDYDEAETPCKAFPFHLLESVPNTCMCRCMAYEMAFQKICDRF